jgi:hypothetical protein
MCVAYIVLLLPRETAPQKLEHQAHQVGARRSRYVPSL